MSAWWHHLTGQPFYWAMDGAHPAAVLLVLHEVLERPSGAPGLQSARLELREWAPVRHLIASLDSGWHGDPSSLVHPRYRAPLWRLRLLAELGVPGDDLAIAEATDRLLDLPLNAPEGVNLNAIVLSIPLALGYGSDPRVLRRLDHLAASLADPLPADPATRADRLAHTVATLAAAVRAGLADPGACERAAERLLAIPLADLGPRWRRFGFPIFDQPDLLFASRHLLLADIRDERVGRWVETVAARQDPVGRWRLERSLQEESGTILEVPAEPSRWLTAQALFVLRAFYGESEG